MYKTQLELRKCKTGHGVFATSAIPANSMILEVTGPVLLTEEIKDFNHPALLQVGPNTYIGASGDLDDYLNHSCDPNCRMHIVGNRAFLYSLYVIPVNGELTFDYSTTSTEGPDTWSMSCLCGSNKCRKVISGAQHLDQSVFEQHKKKGLLPLYITEPNRIYSR